MLRRHSRGFTLIEILLALVLLLVGVTGVMALFPVAVQNVRLSSEDSSAGNVAQSLQAAMTQAMRSGSGPKVTVRHDGTPMTADGSGAFAFDLPTGAFAPVFPAPDQSFPLASDAAASAGSADIRKLDASEPLPQYSWQFTVVEADEDGDGKPEPGLYRFTFRIFRNFDPLYSAMGPGKQRPDLVKEFTVLISRS